MLDSALLKTNFVGRDGFVWWIGRVADSDVWRNEATDTDAGWAYRCKVRIIGYHPFDEEVLPESDLPWAHVLVDATSGSGQGCYGESSRMVGGETVFGFFMDGEEAQNPVVFGALARQNNKSGYGPTNSDVESISGTEANAFGVVSGRKIGGPTTMPASKNQEIGNKSSDESQTKLNAENKVGEETNGEKKGELEGGGEGLSKERKIDQTFSNVQTGPHKLNNGCKDDAVGDIAHEIGSFLTTVNSLTEWAGEWIDVAENTIKDIRKLTNKVARLISAAMKKIMNLIREKVMNFISKQFRNLQALIIPEPQKPFISKAVQKILDIIFCLFDTGFNDLFDLIKDMLIDMIGKAINPTVCAIEQAVANLLASVYDTINNLLAPILSGLDWLLGSLGKIAGLFGKISSYVDMLLSFLSCTGLTCKEYDDWTQSGGKSKLPSPDMESVLDNVEIFQKLDQFADTSGFSGDNESGSGVYDARARFSLLSMMGGGAVEFFDCNNKTNNPQTQDDLALAVPPGFTWSECIPPKVEVLGNGTKTAVLIPIVSSVDGSILTLEIIEPGRNYTDAPTISIIDKTRHGGGARAKAIIDDEGKVVDVYMISPGFGYCTSTNVIPPKYPVTEDTDEENPFITFTTPADDAVGVETSVSLSVTFNEPIVKGKGEVVITEALTNVVHERINVKSRRIEFLSDRIIRIDPKNDLRGGTDYFVTMSEGSFLDMADNQFAGIGRTDTYNFTTKGVSGIGSEAVGIVTTLIPYRPGIGYTSGDNGQVGACTFDLVLTPAGSIAGINNINCQDKHKVIPEVTINTRSGIGAELLPVISYSPDFVSDSGTAPNVDGGFGGGRTGIPTPDAARAGGNLYIKVIDCVYGLGKTQVGWVNGNPYYGDFHVHPSTGVRMVGKVHINEAHAVIYNTKEESLGQPAPVTYTQPRTTNTQTPQADVSDSTVTSETNTSDTSSTSTSTPTTPTTTETTTPAPEQPQQQTPPPTPPSTPPPPTPPSGGGGSGGSGGGGYGGGY